MKLTIDRKVWMRGGVSQLLIDRFVPRQQCCIGIYLTACGIPDSVLRVASNPDGVKGSVPDWLLDKGGTLPDNSVSARELVAINDDDMLTDEEREPKIAAIFARHDIEVEFV